MPLSLEKLGFKRPVVLFRNCEELECVKETLKRLGFNENVVQQVIREINVPLEIVVDKETDFLVSDYCRSSLVAGRSYYKIFKGNTKVKETREVILGCGPDSYYKTAIKYELEPESIVYFYDGSDLNGYIRVLRKLYVLPKEMKLEEGRNYTVLVNGVSFKPAVVLD